MVQDDKNTTVDYDTTNENIFIDQEEAYESFLANEQDKPKSDLSKVMYFSLCFLVLFTAVTGAGNLTAQIYSQLGFNSLGKLNQCVLYAVFCISALFTPAIVKNWGFKNGTFIGSLGFTFTLLAGTITASCSYEPIKDSLPWCSAEGTFLIYAFNMAGSLINGITGPILWTCSYRYVGACADDKNQGFYLGIFSSFVFGAGMTGSLMGKFIIPAFGQFGFYFFAAGLTVLSSLMIFLAPNVKKYGKEGQADTVIDKIMKMAKEAKQKRMRPLLPYMFFVGFLLAIYNGFEYVVIESTIPASYSDIAKNAITAEVFFVEGISTIFASLIAGVLADKLPRRIVLNIFLGLAIIAIVTSYMSETYQSIFYAYIMGCCWGMAYAGGYTLIGVLLTKDFEGRLEAFGVNNVIGNVAIALGFVLCIFVTDIPGMLIISSVLVVITQINTFLYKGKDEKKMPHNDDSFYKEVEY